MSTPTSGGTPVPAEAWFMGTTGRPGHYLWHSDGKSRTEQWPPRIPGFPWPQIDTKWGRIERQGAATFHRQDGWTVLSITDNTDDSRPGSHATFAFHADLSVTEAVEAAKAHFPHIMRRFEEVAVDA